MAKVLVLYYSMYGHVETMAQAVAEGVQRVSGAEVTILRVPESMDAARFAEVGGKVDQQAAEATPDDLTQYDAIIVGTPTRFGNMSGQMRNFWDRTGGLWASGALHGKLASVFTSTGTGGGGGPTPRRGSGTDHHICMDHACPSRHGYYSDWLRHQRDVRYLAGARRNALRGVDAGRRRWLTPAHA